MRSLRVGGNRYGSAWEKNAENRRAATNDEAIDRPMGGWPFRHRGPQRSGLDGPAAGGLGGLGERLVAEDEHAPAPGVGEHPRLREGEGRDAPVEPLDR